MKHSIKRTQRWLKNYKTFKSKEKFDSAGYTVMKDGGRTFRPKQTVVTIRPHIACDPLYVNRIAKNLYLYEKRRRSTYHIFIRNVVPMSSHRGGFIVEYDLYDSFMRFEQVAVFDNDFCLVKNNDVGDLLGSPDMGFRTVVLENGMNTRTELFVKKRHNAIANRSYPCLAS